jgi:hypothetical protein
MPVRLALARLVIVNFVAALAACSSAPGASAADAGPVDSLPALQDDAAASPDVAASPDAATPSCPDGYPLQNYSGKQLLQVTINGLGPYLFAFDTGAPASMIDTGVSQAIGAGPYTLAVGGKTMQVDDFPDVEALRDAGYQLDGFLGVDLVRPYAITLDYGRERFWLDEGGRDEAALLACGHVEGSPALVPYTESVYMFVPGTAETTTGWFLVDTGASLGATTESTFATLQAVSPRPALQGFYTPAFVGIFWAKLAALGSLEVAGKRVSHIMTRTLPDADLEAPAFPDGKPLLGCLPSGYLRHHLVTMDYPGGLLRLDGYAGDSRRDTSIYATGIGLEETTTAPPHVAQVLDGSDAQDQSVQVGDEVVAIGGTQLDGTDPYGWSWGLVSKPSGATISVTLRRSGVESTVQLTTRELLVDPPTL